MERQQITPDDIRVLVEAYGTNAGVVRRLLDSGVQTEDLDAVLETREGLGEYDVKKGSMQLPSISAIAGVYAAVGGDVEEFHEVADLARDLASRSRGNQDFAVVTSADLSRSLIDAVGVYFKRRGEEFQGDIPVGDDDPSDLEDPLNWDVVDDHIPNAAHSGLRASMGQTDSTRLLHPQAVPTEIFVAK